jgi:hypothetical protein
MPKGKITHSRMPPRRRPAPSAVQPLGGAEDDAGAAAEEVQMPAMSFHILKQYQCLFMMMAAAEVRQCGSAGTLSVAEQSTRLLESYKRYVGLWFRGDATLMAHRHMPTCPRALTALGSQETAVRVMLATTSRGTRVHTGVSIREKCKKIKTEMLGLIALWNVACKGSASSSTVVEPGTGETAESIYARLVAVAWRVAETQRVMKLRVSWFGLESAHSAFCTIERIREAYVSHYYATRGFSIQEQQQDMSSANAGQRRARYTIRRQIEEIVEADFERNGQPAVPSSAPSDQQLRASFEEVDHNCSSTSCFSLHRIIITSSSSF